MNKKLRKLARDPQLFLKDLLRKRRPLRGADAEARPHHLGRYRYSVVSAVYGVAPYLDKFFKSLIEQSLPFTQHIELILVDDGSTDSSAAIIERWRARFPGNIRLLRKPNGGQASARNAGLPLATGDWVTFIDPDDFVHRRYFEEVDRLLSRPDARNVALVACRLVFYREKTRGYSDTHPLRQVFRAGDRILSAAAPADFVQLSASSAFFRRTELVSSGVVFDERTKPNFEDGLFVNRFLIDNPNRNIGLASRAQYYYRKREDFTSTVDGSWNTPAKYADALEFGYLALLRHGVETLGHVPTWLQRTVLYDAVWYFKYLINHPERASFLSPTEVLEFKRRLRLIFEHIEPETILDFELSGVWFYHKLGLLQLFKSPPDFQIVYCEAYDSAKHLVRLRYFCGKDVPLEVFLLDETDTAPCYAKRRCHDFLDETFVTERIVWLPLGSSSAKLTARLGTTPTRLSVKGKQFKDGVRSRELIAMLQPRPLVERKLLPRARALRLLARSSFARSRFANAWLFMDRDTRADDNAEHLYRHVLAQHPEINSFFVLRKSSPDWKRLRAEGFRLLSFDSLEHHLALLNARHLISSHADTYILDLLPRRHFSDLLGYRFTFLQHGVIKHDLSTWLNPKPIDCFVTASRGEYESIAGDDTRYQFSLREVVLTGLPRHDALLAPGTVRERIILVMPTWRSHLVGKQLGQTGAREYVDSFCDSEFASRWRSLLHSEALLALAKNRGFRIVFAPHANLAPYVGWFDVPPPVELWTQEAGTSMQSLFRSAAVLVTDYSSVVFEMALLKEPVVYFQFDSNDVFFGGHTTQRGYFDYHRDGFGPVCSTEAEVVAALEQILQDGVAPEYARRMLEAIEFRDGRNCARVFQAIRNLDGRECDRAHEAAILIEAAERASAAGEHVLAAGRWDRVLRLADAQPPDTAKLRLSTALRHLKRFDEAKALLEGLPSSAAVVTERAELADALGDAEAAVGLWQRIFSETDVSKLGNAGPVATRLGSAFRRTGRLEQAWAVLAPYSGDGASVAIRVENAEIASAFAHWSEAERCWHELSQLPSTDAPAHWRIRLGEARLHLGNVVGGLAVLAPQLQVEPNGDTADIWLRAAELVVGAGGSASLAGSRSIVARVGAQLTAATQRLRLARLCRQLDWLGEAEPLLSSIAEGTSLQSEVALERLELYRSRRAWTELAAASMTPFEKASPEARNRARLLQVQAMRHIGQLEAALQVAQNVMAELPESGEVLFEFAELSHLAGHWHTATAWWRRLQGLHPEYQPDFVTARLIQALDAQGDAIAAISLLASHTHALAMRQLHEKPSDLGLAALILHADAQQRAFRDGGCETNSHQNRADLPLAEAPAPTSSPYQRAARMLLG